MITTITTIRLPKPVTRDEARRIFLSTAPTYRGVPGLFRKCYVLSEDGSHVGGLYLWRSRADAEAAYSESWKAFVRDTYGVDPLITFFESPVVVDNVLGRILRDDEPLAADAMPRRAGVDA